MIEETPPLSDTANDAESDSVKFSFDEGSSPSACIKVVGVGGGGCNAVNRMIEAGIGGVQFFAVNTDVQALSVSHALVKLQLGAQLTRGYGAGSDHKIGRNAALDDTERLNDLLNGADMVFVAAGFGGGTGTGAAPVVASLAKQMGALTVAIVTTPFAFEGARRMEVAQQGLAALTETVDTVITIPNERLLAHVDRGTSFFESFRIADDILLHAVQGISDIITIPGMINCDFADVRAVMLGAGHAVMGMATRGGESAAIEAARAAVSSPLLENANIDGSSGILINITGSSHLGLHEAHEASMIIQEAADANANIIFGVVPDDSMGENVKVTVIATGFQDMKTFAGNSTAPGQDIRAEARQTADDFFSISESEATAPALTADSAAPDTSQQDDGLAGLSDPALTADSAAPDTENALQPAPDPLEFDGPVNGPQTAPTEEEDINRRPAIWRRRSSG